jgi:hypothetical protein
VTNRHRGVGTLVTTQHKSREDGRYKESWGESEMVKRHGKNRYLPFVGLTRVALPLLGMTTTALFCHSAMAQPTDYGPEQPTEYGAGVEEGDFITAVEPAAPAEGVPVGPFIALPRLALDLGYDDNVFRSERNEVDSLFYVIRPGGELQADYGPNAYSLLYELAVGRYDDARQNDFVDHELVGTADLEFTARNRLGLELAYLKLHDPIGTSRTAGEQDVPSQQDADRFDLWNADGRYSYGASGAKGRLDLFGGYLSKEYKNNRNQTRQFDRDEGNIGTTFFWRVQPDTALLVEFENTKFDYDSSDLSSTERRYLGGVTWAATAKSTGTAKFGYLEKDFDEPQFGDFEGSSWEVGVAWAPRTYSTLDLRSSRRPQEASTSGSFKNVTRYAVLWNHQWRERLSSQAGFSYATEAYGDSSRNDDRLNLGLRADYQIRRWLSFGISYTYDDNDSNQNRFDYTRNIYRLLINAAL